MGVMDTFLKAMQLNDSEAEYEDDDLYDDEDYADEPEVKPSKKKSVVKEEADYEEPAKPKSVSNKVTPMRQPKKVAAAAVNGMDVCVIKPTSVEDAREITETLLANRTVVLNLEGLDVDVAQRIIDFTSGSCFAISGNLQKISHYIFIITPSSVAISGDFQEILSGSFDVPAFNNPL